MEQVAIETLQARPVDAATAMRFPEKVAPGAAAPRVPRWTPVGRWLSLRAGALRAAALAIFSLLMFVVAWHLLTRYRVHLYVRFVHVPSPEAVFERAVRALHDPRFFAHVVLSCRR